MIRDRRQLKTLTQDVVEKSLNHEQLSTLLNSEQFGWRLWFIRNPLFPEPLPVLYHVQHDHVGALEADGHINTDVRLTIRSDDNRYNDLNLILQVSASTQNVGQKERRGNKSAAVGNLDDLLNQHRLRALRNIESSGWKLFCVRISLFKEAEVVIVNAEGDMFATLEHDGEINMAPDLSLRKADWPVGIEKRAIVGSG